MLSWEFSPNEIGQVISQELLKIGGALVVPIQPFFWERLLELHLPSTLGNFLFRRGRRGGLLIKIDHDLRAPVLLP